MTTFYSSAEVNEVIAKIKPDYLQQDIKQHTFLELLEKPDEVILDLHSRGKIKAFIVKVIFNTANFKNGKLLRQYRRETEIPTETFQCTPCECNLDYEHMVKKATELKNNMYWFKKELLEMYVEHGSYRKVSELTRIPMMSVYDTIKNSRKEIKEALWD